MHNTLRVAVSLSLLLLVSGCGALDYFFLPPPEDTAQELYEAGQEAMREKHYSTAVDYFTKLKDRYPFSPYTPRAELGLGDAFYLDEDYAMAVEAYKEFETLHPRHEEMDYVLYQIGMANFMASDAIDKPQTTAREALQYFLRVRESYPDSPYAEKAAEYVQETRRKLAEHELFVADFYWRSSQYGSAYRRYSFVASNFPDLPEVMAYAENRAELAYLLHQQQRSRDELEKREGSWKDYFDWL